MRISRLDTVRTEEFPNLVHLLIHTDEGLIGLGRRSSSRTRSRDTSTACCRLPARQEPGGHRAPLERAARLRRRGLERSRDARRLGGRHRALGPARQGARPAPPRPARWRCHETDQDLQHVRRLALRPWPPRPGSMNWGIYEPSPDGRHEDLEAFLHHPAQLARRLLDEGVAGMKIWPFDPYAEASLGHDISAAELELALEPFRQIRDAVGAEMDVMVELHGALGRPRRVPDRGGAGRVRPVLDRGPRPRDERRRPRRGPARDACADRRWRDARRARRLRDLLARDGARIVIFDLGWVGGITEARKVAALAEAHERPVAPHDCTGPVVYMAATHMSLHLPNAIRQESVRAFYDGLVPGLRNRAAGDRARHGLGASGARARARLCARGASSATTLTSAALVTRAEEVRCAIRARTPCG